ncbi:MAG: glycosyltransferase, partial [Clostridia bacterium]
MKLSITMIVKNESKHLKKCLESLLCVLQMIDAELIIVDTGSEDNTMEIAKAYTDKAYFHPWNGNFADMRNITIDYATGEWIFVIDGDEVVENPHQLVEFLKSNQTDNYNTGVVAIKSHLSEDSQSAYEIHLAPRLFRNSKEFRYEGAVHEQPKFEQPVLNVGVQLLHYGYISTDPRLMERKFYRNVEILKAELEKNQENIYYWFQLAQSYGMHKDYKEALDAVIKAHELVKNKKADRNKYKFIYSFLAYAYYWNNEYKKVEEICKQAIKIKDGHLDNYYFLGHAQMKLSKVEQAIESFKMYLKIHAGYDKSNIDFIEPIYTLGYVEEVYVGLGILYKGSEQYDQAIEYVNLIESDQFISRGMSTIVDLYIKSNQYNELRKYYETKLSDKKEDLINQFIACIESAMQSLEKTKKSELIQVFTEIDNPYSVLNIVRLEELDDHPINEELLRRIEALDINSLPDYYGDVVYYLLKREIDIKSIFPNLRENKLFNQLRFLSNKDDLSSIILRYLKLRKATTESNDLRINKSFAKYALLQNQLDKDDYRYMLDRYIEDGTRYLREIYNPKMIENEMIYDLKDDEDVFLLYIYLGQNVKHKNITQYTRYLRKALKAYPYMKEVIELLLEEVKEIVNASKNSANEQGMINKDTINVLINQGQTEEALVLIKEYESAGQKDAELYSMEAVIAMMDNRLEDAEEILQAGLEIDNNNCDLIYNAAYLYQLKGQYEAAIQFYDIVLQATNDQKIKGEINSTLEQLYNHIDKSSVNMKKDAAVELDRYKRRVKDEIKELLNNNQFEQSGLLIAEYEKIIPNDLEIVLLKST